MNIIPQTTEYLKKDSVGVVKMWKTPLFLEYINTYVFFLDTEGYELENTVRESVLMILLIISSVVIINVKLCSDFEEDFKIFPEILKKICVFYNDNQEDLNFFLANMLMVQRDFGIKLDFSLFSGHFTGYEFFEENSKIPPNLSTIRDKIKFLFRERDYVVCSQPTYEDDQLPNLIKDLGQKLTDDFNQELNKIRDKLLYSIQPKSLFNVNLKPKLMGSFMKYLVNDINEVFFKEKRIRGSILISSCWKKAVEDAYEEAFNESCDYYYDELQRFFSDDKPRKRMKLFKLLSTMREEVLN